MKIANTEVAGITGGVYERFDRFGLRFFSALIGEMRAERLELEYTRVRAGGTVIGSLLGIVVGLLAFGIVVLTKGSSDASLGWIAIGATYGGVLFLILSAILVHYIKALRNEDVRSQPKPLPDTRFEEIAERRKKYLDSGYSSKDASREAWWFATLTNERSNSRS